MRVTLISPEAAVFDGEADAVIAPGFDGELGILPNHAPLMTTLGRGRLTVRVAGVEKRYRVQGGFLQVVQNSVRILAETVETENDVA